MRFPSNQLLDDNSVSGLRLYLGMSIYMKTTESSSSVKGLLSQSCLSPSIPLTFITMKFRLGYKTTAAKNQPVNLVWNKAEQSSSPLLCNSLCD